MSQNDFVIANDTAANVRADINSAFAAAVSNSSGASAPSTTYAGMLWNDTTTNLLKIRSDADDAWITVGTLDQSGNTFAAEVGSSVATLTGTQTLTNKTLTSPVINGTVSGTAVFVPTGAVIFVAQNTAPTGYIKANGAAVSRTTYATLFAAIGTTFGVGDGSTTFDLPDLRGEFMRGWDDARGVDSGRAFGSFQDHQIEEHQHLVNRRTVLENPSNSSSGGGYLLQDWGRSSGVADNEVRDVQAANVGAETRPRNVALLACIKF